MTNLQILITIAIMAIITLLTRFLPFLIFRGKTTPRYIQYLGQTLPPASFALLVVYSLKNVDIIGSSHGLPELIAIAIVTLTYLWKKNLLLSVASGTIIYMVLIQLVF